MLKHQMYEKLATVNRYSLVCDIISDQKPVLRPLHILS
jgi:hypothetical protein